ncbi:glycosyltransferase family 25 protein [Komagataeibacter oboediens]
MHPRPHDQEYRFPHILIISLPHAIQRRELLTRQLAGFGLDFEFMNAVDATSLTERDYGIYNRCRRRIFMGKDLYPGEIACLLSHKKALQQIAAKDRPWIVLEDDVLLSPDWPYVVRALMQRRDEWEFVRFFGDAKHATRLQRKLVPLGRNYWLTRISTTPGGAHAYLVSPSGARKILRCLHYTATPIDTLMGQPWKTGLGALSVWPGLARENGEFPSYIGNARFVSAPTTTGLERALYFAANPGLRLVQNILKRGFYYGHALPDRWHRCTRQQAGVAPHPAER